MHKRPALVSPFVAPRERTVALSERPFSSFHLIESIACEPRARSTASAEKYRPDTSPDLVTTSACRPDNRNGKSLPRPIDRRSGLPRLMVHIPTSNDRRFKQDEIRTPPSRCDRLSRFPTALATRFYYAWIDATMVPCARGAIDYTPRGAR